MKKWSHFLSISLLALSISMLTACGGGGGSSSDDEPNPPSPPKLVINSFAPTNSGSSTTDIDAEVVIKFNKEIDPASLYNPNAKIGALVLHLNLQNLFSYSLEILKKDEVTGDFVPVSDAITLAEIVYENLQSGNYKIRKTPQSGAALLYDTSTLTVDRSFDPDTRLITYSLFAKQEGATTAEEVTSFDSSQLVASGVNLESSTIAVVDNNSVSAPGKLLLNGKEVKFIVDRFFKWDTTYTVTVTSGISTKENGGLNLNNQKVWTFKTDPKPEPAITNNSPIGSLASAINPIRITFNYDVGISVDPEKDQNCTNNYKTLFSIKKVLSNTVSEDVDVNCIFDEITRTVTFEPTQLYLDYNSTFQVRVFAGLAGENGIDPDTLKNEFIWNFNTAPVRIVSYSPVGSSETSPDVHPDPLSSEVDISVNFNVDADSFINNLNNVELREVNGPIVPVDRSLSLNSSKMTLTPVSALRYDTQYEVFVGTGLYSSISSSIRLENNFTWKFTTQQRIMTSEFPLDGSDNFSLNDTIYYNFNFDVDRSIFNSSNTSTCAMKITYYTAAGNQKVKCGSVKTTNLRHASFSASDFAYGTTFNVNLDEKKVVHLQSGQSLSNNSNNNKTFVIQDKYMTVVSNSPTSSNTDVWPLIYAKFVGDVYLYDDDSINGSIQLYEKCTGNYRNGDVYTDNEFLYFNPWNPLESFCDYTMYVGDDIYGFDGEDREGSSYSWNFSTGGLELDYFEFTIADYFWNTVDIDTSITLDFNKDVDIQWYSGINLYEDMGFFSLPLSTTEYTYGDQLVVNPIFSLDYDTDYRLEVDYDALVGPNGEELEADEIIYFTTEEDPFTGPLYVDYGPTGNVDDQGDFYVEFDQTINSWEVSDAYIEEYDSFWGWTEISSTYSTSGSFLDIRSSSFLSYDKEYRIVAYGDSFYVEWTVDTYLFSFRPANTIANSNTSSSTGTVAARGASVPQARTIAKDLTDLSVVASNRTLNASKSCQANSGCNFQVQEMPERIKQIVAIEKPQSPMVARPVSIDPDTVSKVSVQGKPGVYAYPVKKQMELVSQEVQGTASEKRASAKSAARARGGIQQVAAKKGAVQLNDDGTEKKIKRRSIRKSAENGDVKNEVQSKDLVNINTQRNYNKD